jgi:hypothetical protein
MAKTIRAARHYQDRDAPVRRIADAGVGAIKRDVKQALMHLGTLVPNSALQYARAGDWHGLRRDIRWGHFREVLKGAFARIGKIREEGAQLGARKINGVFSSKIRAVRFRKFGHLALATIEKDVGSRFTFDLYDQNTQDRIRRAQDDLIQQLDREARDSIAEIILAGAQTGLGPDEIVEDIRSLIGLTDRQARAVMNYQRMLYELDPDALVRRLRNTEHDQAVQDALDSGESLSDTAIAQMTADYAENYLDYRAETIARTEATRAANAGLQDAYAQAIDRGALPVEAVTQFWEVALDEKTCEICLSIPDMNPDGVGIGEPFESIDGQQDAPPDPHPSCRCSLEIVTDLDKVPDEA